MALELDALDRRAASVFEGYLVRKDLVRKYSRQYPVPTYVVEFLLGRYCATTDEEEIEEGLAIVERQLADRTVRTGTRNCSRRGRVNAVPSNSSTSRARDWIRARIR